MKEEVVLLASTSFFSCQSFKTVKHFQVNIPYMKHDAQFQYKKQTMNDVIIVQYFH